MGKAEDALRARAEAAVEARRLEEAKRQQEAQPAIEELRQEIQRTLNWLEQHDWPDGELRLVNNSREERAMWDINPNKSEVSHRDITYVIYLDSTGALQQRDMRRGGSPVEIDISCLLDATRIRTQYTEPIRKMRQS